MLDDLRIYNRALSAAEVKALYEGDGASVPTYGPWGEAEAVKNPDKLGPTMLTDMTLELNGAAGAVGDVVAAFRGDTGTLCGLGKVMDEPGTLTMACYVPTGVKLHFKVWVAASGVEEPVVVDCDAKSDLTAPTSGAFLSGHALVVTFDAQWREIGGDGESGGGAAEGQHLPEPVVEIVEPVRAFVAPAQKAVMSGAVLAADGSVEGFVQLDVGKVSKKGASKVTVTIFGIDGKKMKSKAVQVATGAGLQRVTFNVKGYGPLTLDIGSDGFIGRAGGETVASVKNRAATGGATVAFSLTNGSALNGLLAQYLPDGVKVTRTAKKWTTPKAGKLKYVKPNEKKGVAGGLVATGENISKLKLSYKAKTGVLKGTFKIWTFDEAKKKLKSVSAKVTGVVIDGVGYCEATVKKQKIGDLIVE